jgi:glycosyltransferase involved in cell wall biosynthesis
MNNKIYFNENYLPNKFQEGLLSIMMPVFNGERFLVEAIESLLLQTYTNFEIIILDNQSTDKTQDICKKYQRQDKRVKLIIDSERRNPHDAANKLAEFIKGEFCMIACDDDIWSPNYAEKMIEILNKNSILSMAYSNAKYIDIDSNEGRYLLLPERARITINHSKLRNIVYYLYSRRVVPVIFGIYRTKYYLKALPFVTFDETIADVDNVFMIKILLNGVVENHNEPLFYYRNKYRWMDPSVIKDIGNFYKKTTKNIKHQFNVWLQINNLILQYPKMSDRLFLQVGAFGAFLYFIGPYKIRILLGKLLVFAKLRYGPTNIWDISAEERSKALNISKNK